ncbi:DUF3021 family protein [Arcanobacterium pinnipediorum]|uniref:DUF3021 family protein n=1 Tax=Arcanobacterium pinnipediorum TaxID=1503041 RepID=A0ABY5AGF2_9ACTO|nr:DUF3021 family protein [Arcanobacterium pinnipediorum]USR78791.1 DUF3021 family protein [Arcanobacterium pinnipediorum]
MKKNLFMALAIAGLCGIGLGVSSELLIAAITGTDYAPGTPGFIAQFDSEITAIALQRFFYALYAIVAYATIGLLKTTNWTPLAKLSVHGTVMAVVGAVIGFIAHWWPTVLAGLGFFVFVLTSYMLFWIGYLVLTNYRIAIVNRHLHARFSLPKSLEFFEPLEPIITARDFTAELIAFKEREKPDLFIVKESMEPLVEFNGQRYRALLEHPRVISTSSVLVTALSFITAFNFGFKYVYFHPVDDNDVVIY